MRKPLELTVYEIDRSEPSMVVVDGFWAYRPYDPAKRLTDAELAAEYQNARLVSYVRHRRVENYPGDMVLFDHYERGLDHEWVLKRFATHPHYDEVI